MSAGIIAPLPARRVRRLHLRAASDDDAARGATLIGDALHTASLPFADHGRFVVVRRLNLGRISSHVSAASIALQIERATRDLVAQAVSWDTAAALDANVVVFASRSEAIMALASTHAKDASTDAWFWSSVVPGWAAASRRDRWRCLLDAAHDVPGAAITAASVVERALIAGVEDTMLAAITPGDALRWLAAENWDRGAESEVAGGPLSPATAHAAVIDRWEGKWGRGDRILWLTTMLAIIARPAAAADRALPRRVVQSRRHRRVPDTDVLDDGVGAPSAPLSGSQAQRMSGTSRGTAHASNREASSNRASIHTDDRDDARDIELTAAPAPALLEGEATPFGGLLFSLAILERLGFAAFLADTPHWVEQDYPSELIRSLGLRVGMTDGDPLARALLPRAEITAVPDHAAIDRMPRAVIDILMTPAPRGRIESPLDLWVAAVRRWCRRHVRIALATLIRRPARVHISRTHIEATFLLSQLDVRIRRLALDVDPGWVPYLGRVVRFHYGGER